MEKYADVYHKTSRGKGELRAKAAKIYCMQKEHSGSEMIDISVKAL